MEVAICLVELTQVSRKAQLLLHPIDPREAAPAQHSLAPGRLSLHCACRGCPRDGAEGLGTFFLTRLCPLSTVMGAPGSVKGSWYLSLCLWSAFAQPQ